MPKYQVSLSDGRKFEVEADGQPSESDIMQALGQGQQSSSAFPSLDTSDIQSDAPKTTDGLTGPAAIGTELARGLGTGTGQMIADAGFLVNAATLGEFPQLQQAGQKIMQSAEGLPATDMGGFSKGALNLVGEAAPMLATFGAGEAIGLAKVGENFIKGLGVASKSPAIAHYMKSLIRPMGQGTLFGTINAIETAATQPETMAFNERVNNIVNSGTTGFITGATLTPILDKGLDVARKLGSNAGKAYFAGLGFSKEATEQALDPLRKVGTYDSLVIDPLSKNGYRFVKADVKKTTPEAMKIHHENIIRDQEIEVRKLRDMHRDMSNQLSDDIERRRNDFENLKNRVDFNLDTQLAERKAQNLNDINTKLGEKASQYKTSLEQLSTSNSQNLNTTAQAFEKTAESTIDLMTKNADAAYLSIMKNEPTGGFDVKSITERIRGFLKKEHNVSLEKQMDLPKGLEGLDLSKMNPSELMQLESQTGTSWVAKPSGITATPRPESKNVIDLLTRKDGLLTKLEEIGASNDGKVTLTQLLEESEKIRQMAYPKGVPGDNGMKDLYRAIRPSQLVGTADDLAKASEDYIFGGKGAKKVNPSAWRGTKASEDEMRRAAMLDTQASKAIDILHEIRSQYLTNIESKAKGAIKNPSALDNLRLFEDTIKLPADSPIRLSNAMKVYDATSRDIEIKAERLAKALERAKTVQRFKLDEAIKAEKFERSQKLLGKKRELQQGFTAERRTKILEKEADLRHAEDMTSVIKSAIEKERFSRAMAEKEMELVATGNHLLSRSQRGFITGTGFALIYGLPAAPLLVASTLALSPRVAIEAGRIVTQIGNKLGKSGTAKALGNIAKNKYTKQLTIGEILKNSRSTSS